MRRLLSSAFVRPFVGTLFWLVAFAWSISSTFAADLVLATNGRFTELWDLPFVAEVASDHLHYGKENVLVVRVHNAVANGGIWRPVLIYALEPNAKKSGLVGQEAALASLRAAHKERKWKELIEKFGKANFTDWPEEQAVEALHLRGQTYSILKMGKEAEADLKLALKLAPHRELIWLTLADNYRDALNDDEQALASYRHLFKLTGKSNGWISIHTTISIARVLTDQVKTDEALAVLKQYGNMEAMHPVWRIKMLRAYGHAYTAQGKEAEALEKFREALRWEAKK